MIDAAAAQDGTLRIDKLLWYLRFVRSRTDAQALVATGHVRLDGRRVDRPSMAARVGSVVVMPHGSGAIVVRITRLPVRRGPASEAMLCYDLGGGPVDDPPFA